MALKFLNKKGWHTGSLRNIENVWKAEQKRDAEEKKLEELRKQIHEERERSEFRLLQEQAGLVPKQERLEFLYDSGLAVGKGSSDGFKALETLPRTDTASTSASASTSTKQESIPGALFEEKPQSANDAWRKLHSDPLLMIRQREQEALARVKNNPIQMAMIRKSVEAKKHLDSEEKGDKREHRKKHHHKKSSKHEKSSSSNDQLKNSEKKMVGADEKRRTHHKSSHKSQYSDEESSKRENQRNKTLHKDRDSDYIQGKERENGNSHQARDYDSLPRESHHHKRSHKSQYSDEESRKRENQRKKTLYKERDTDYIQGKERENGNSCQARDYESLPRESHHKRRNIVPKLTEEERAARLREMQVDAELHEEQRWKRLKKADEDDAREAMQTDRSRGRNFLDAAHKSVYGAAEKGGSATIEESVRRRSYYLQGRSDALDANAFRR